MKIGNLFVLGVLYLALTFGAHAQTRTQAKAVPARPAVALPEVTVIDQAGLMKAVKPNGKSLLINFWATWCDPCRDEFPDLVKINAEYNDRVDLITISLDDLIELKRGVPKFLSEMKADMPAYVLHVPDEGAAISSVYDEWTGGLPFTIIFDKNGKMSYSRQGKFSPATLRAELDKLLPSTPVASQ